MTVAGYLVCGIILVRAALAFRQDYVWIKKKGVPFKEYWETMYKNIKKGA